MKGFNILGAFLSGAIVGAVFGILFAPEKGEDTRELIAQKLRDKGIKLSKSDLDELVDEIASEVKEIAD
ncbi:MAG: YtxH domain-containing protein [Bacteroides sp.]|nr:YtxH domain-containing protein [Bacteroides sp.]MDD4054367.1 YtxH domain-containing protein [Bacteroides sp.]MDD4719608.1 YtxH domain-containing protein [Bacteroides sp.]NLI64797.1 YtxH domain-containing protein [Bacteroidales bacterium]